MKRRTFTVTQFLPRTRERIFPFFEKAENLALITPRWLDFRILSAVPVKMKVGREIDYRIRLSGLPVHWRTLISHYDPPLSFVDEQLTGPYAYWRHLHRFESVTGGTRLVDEVEYGLPEWLPILVSEFFDSTYIKPRIEKIFAYRNQVVAVMFGNPLPIHQSEDELSTSTTTKETEACD